MTQALHGDERTATAQMIYMALASAPAQAITTLISGELYEYLNITGRGALGYLSMTAVAVLGTGLAWLLWLRRDVVAVPQGAAA
jgi:PPP family 3-phenylpropionic acid transporter